MPISQIKNTLIENADNAMSMYNLIEDCENYSITSGIITEMK